MAYIIGSLVNLGVALEATRGVGLMPQYWMPWTTLNFDDKTEKHDSPEALGFIDQYAETRNVMKWGEGSIEGEVRDRPFGLLLHALLGTKGVAADGAAYLHTFTINQANQHPTLSLFVDDPNGDYIFEMCMMSSLEINIEAGQVVTYVSNFMSRPSSTTSVEAGVEGLPALSAAASDNKFIGAHATIKISTARGNLDEASEIKIQRLKISVNKNLYRKHVLGTMQPEDIFNQQLLVEGEFTLPYNDKQYKNLDLDNSYRAMSIDLTNNEVDLGGGKRPALIITLPRVAFRNWTPTRTPGELYEQTISFQAYRDMTNNENSIYNIQLRNAVASY